MLTSRPGWRLSSFQVSSTRASHRAMLVSTRGSLRFAAGGISAAITDLRQAVALSQELQITNPMGASWRSALALMLPPSQLEEALNLIDAELINARRAGNPRRVGVALRALGVLEPDRDRGRAHLEEAVTLLSCSPARLEHARALVELGSDRRRRGERAAARPPLREGLDLAVRAGAVRLAERARTELAAAGARPRRELWTGRDALTPSELRVREWRPTVAQARRSPKPFLLQQRPSTRTSTISMQN